MTSETTPPSATLVPLRRLLDYLRLALHLTRLSRAQRKMVRKGFDESFYLRDNPDVAASGMLPSLHYARYGVREGRAPAAVPIESAVTSLPSNESLDTQFAALASAFDRDYYLARYPDIIESAMTPLEHFILYGAKEGRNPAPWFDTHAYRMRYPDAMKLGSNPLLHYTLIGREKDYSPGAFGVQSAEIPAIARALRLHPNEMIKQHRAQAQDVIERVRSGELGRQFLMAAEIDPLVAHARLALFECGVQPLRGVRQARRLSAMLDLQDAAGHLPARAVVLMPWNQIGGATKLAGQLVTAMASTLGTTEVVVVTTEAPSWDFPQWFPAEVRRLDFSTPSRPLEGSDRTTLLFEFLRSLDPEVIVNVNSPMFWPLLENYGPQLRDRSRLASYFFCNEKSASGDWVGFPVRNFHHHQPLMDTVLVDSHALKSEFTERFLLSGPLVDQIRVLDTPIADGLPLMEPPTEGNPPVVFWAGRFDRQKRVDIVYDIAARLPRVEFRLWGQAKLDRSVDRLNRPPNVQLMGAYNRLSEIPLGEADLWLYTSEWDGVPNMLLEVATTGIPLVGSLAGGCGEVLELGYSQPVASVEDVDGFVRAIEEVLRAPAAARAKASALREYVLETRSPHRYQASVAAALRLEAGLD